MVFDGKGHLFLSSGDRMMPPQGDLEAHAGSRHFSDDHGSILRLDEDGSIPKDNPFVGKPNAKPGALDDRQSQSARIWRLNPADWRFSETEHGPQGGDELNLILPGANYGWPVITYGVNYRARHGHRRPRAC